MQMIKFNFVLSIKKCKYEKQNLQDLSWHVLVYTLLRRGENYQYLYFLTFES